MPSVKTNAQSLLLAVQPWSTVPKGDLRLVCATGCAPVDSWATCNLARVPTAAGTASCMPCTLQAVCLHMYSRSCPPFRYAR
jgi:hypothetical protein